MEQIANGEDVRNRARSAFEHMRQTASKVPELSLEDINKEIDEVRLQTQNVSQNHMKQAKKDQLMNCSTLDELLNVEYGEPGTVSRQQFDEETRAFCLAQTQKEECLRDGLPQEPAEKCGRGKFVDTLSTREEVFKGCITLEESKRRLTEKVNRHFDRI